MTACSFSGKRIGLGFGCRVEQLVTVEVQSSQDGAQDEDERVGGYGTGHDRREKERSTNKRERQKARFQMMGQEADINRCI